MIQHRVRFNEVGRRLADRLGVPAGPHAGLRGAALLPPQGELTGFGWEQNADAFTELTGLGVDRLGSPSALEVLGREVEAATADRS